MGGLLPNSQKQAVALFLGLARREIAGRSASYGFLAFLCVSVPLW